ncbi:hypothetical protein [Prescottella equi]|uniref:Uncharacterized protein n=2 Tax=root TaxID=1 RepID=G9FHA5_9CAUD|nr:hypothetical protein [Prescottella equi]YP_005087250.1 hypothetical protein RoPhREQ3_gp58 [Rhodococcus phage REQ3]AEV51994.1 hypothetical protein [Rhodococcus phage REQ3]ERN43231.1 hypothetical protein H849_24219 [Prescottella equi NBRC 101255 = C 7]MBM4716150.1 hypothetical protein [Prescottella equi]ORL29085.1 hypothetical protein A6I89_02020 [Prescottella equi]QPQ77251.1 hypothetical protein I6H09_24370 [Prescottella equi]
MAHIGKFYGSFLLSAMNKEVDLDSDTLKVMLCTSAYTPNQDTHRYKSSITGEVSGSGYTAGGVTLTGVTVTYDAATNTLKLDADDASWPAATITARHAVIYDSTPGSDATRPLIGYTTFDQDISSTAAAFQLIWDPAGICTMTVS